MCMCVCVAVAAAPARCRKIDATPVATAPAHSLINSMPNLAKEQN
jgi:hypothetical protein